MADLEGKTIASTYRSLLHVGTANNQELTSTPQVIQDGAGGTTKLFLSTDSVLISGSGTKLNFYDDDSEYISADASGNLTINAQTKIILTAPTVDISGDLALENANWIGISGSDERLTFYTAGYAHFMGANVGFGETSPDRMVHINSGTVNTGLIVEGTDNSQAITAFDSAAGKGVEFGNDAGKFYLATNNSTNVDGTGTRALTIGTDQYVGINTTSPDYRMEIVGTSASHSHPRVLSIKDTNTRTSGSGGYVQLSSDGGSPLQSGHQMGRLDFAGSEDSSNNIAIGASIYATAGGNWDGDKHGGSICLATSPDSGSGINPQVRLKINDVGKVSIGLHSADEALHVEDSGGVIVKVNSTALADTESSKFQAIGTGNSVESYAELGTIYENGSDTNAPTSYIRLEASDGQASYIFVGDDDELKITTTITDIGKISGPTVVGDQTSDERLKNISSDAFPYGLSEVNEMTPIRFTYKNVKVPTNALGFGAQTIQSIIPESVLQTNDCIDGYDESVDELGEKTYTPKSDNNKMMMKYYQLIPVLVKAIQELSAKVDALENA